MNISFRDPHLLPLWDKIRNGERLNERDGLVLYNSGDLVALGRMAQEVNYRLNGDAVYFSLNQKIEPTNICVRRCRFCAFSVRPDSPRAYALSQADILEKITAAQSEVHITGALHPDHPWDYHLGLVASIRKNFPQVGIKAFTAVEIDYFCRRFGLSLEEALRRLKEAGLDSLPGGGAEIFSERVRRLLCPNKMGAQRWLAVHRAAHQAGIPTNATMLYGHIETREERIHHLSLLRELQDETGGFLSFIPLPFQPGKLGLTADNRPASAVEDMKTIAVSRIFLDNFPHIKAYWVMLTPEGASLALNFGADDLDGTVGGERIAHDAGAKAPPQLSRDDLVAMIAANDRLAVERDVQYRPLAVTGDDVIGKIPYLNSVPFYHYFPRRPFRLLPVAPRRMGVLSRQGRIAGGLFSLRDYWAQEDDLAMLDYGIASGEEVGSVLLFSRLPWQELEDRSIGVTDDTATSVTLLKLLLEQKYNVNSTLKRLSSFEKDIDSCGAVLLIGDPALRKKKQGFPGFPHVFDLAKEWHCWQGLPFVFAVWAYGKALPVPKVKLLQRAIEQSLERAEREMSRLVAGYRAKTGLTLAEATAYLTAFTYRLGTKEREAMVRFRGLIDG